MSLLATYFQSSIASNIYLTKHNANQNEKCTYVLIQTYFVAETMSWNKESFLDNWVGKEAMDLYSCASLNSTSNIYTTVAKLMNKMEKQVKKLKTVK